MRTSYRNPAVVVPELEELFRIGHVVDPHVYFLYSTVIDRDRGTVETLVFLEREVEATGGENPAIEALLDETMRRAKWAREAGSNFVLPWLATSRKAWQRELGRCFEKEAVAFLQRRVDLWREALAGDYSELVRAVASALERTANRLEPDVFGWLRRAVLARFRRMVEEELGRAAADGLSADEWGGKLAEYAVADRPRRLELKAVTVDLLHAVTRRLAHLAAAELRLDLAPALAEVREILETQRVAEPAPVSLPRRIPQYTFMEARNLGMALADGPTRHRWRERGEDQSLQHEMVKQPVRVRLGRTEPERMPDDLGEAYRTMYAQLRTFNLSTVLLLNVAIELVLSNPGRPVLVDDLIRAIGWVPGSRQDRFEMREQIWEWVRVFDRLTVHGRRPGTYFDPATKKSLDLTSEDALIRITGKRFETDRPDAAPVEVTWTAGPWLDAFRGNSSVLQHFGDIRKIAEIAAGKPSGAWARSIGLALNQLWRERATRAEVRPVEVGGEAGTRLTALYPPFTRAELLGMFRTEPLAEEVLKSDKPGRAKVYWDGAVRRLRAAGVIGHYAVTPSRLTGRRNGWQETWLHEDRLDIRPKEAAVPGIAALGKVASRRSVRKPD